MLQIQIDLILSVRCPVSDLLNKIKAFSRSLFIYFFKYFLFALLSLLQYATLTLSSFFVEGSDNEHAHCATSSLYYLFSIFDIKYDGGSDRTLTYLFQSFWNELPLHIRQDDSFSVLKSSLKFVSSLHCISFILPTIFYTCLLVFFVLFALFLCFSHQFFYSFLFVLFLINHHNH